MSFLRLAESLAEHQGHGMKGGKAPIASHPKMTPAKLVPKDRQRKLTRPGHEKVGRKFQESPRKPPLSILDG